MTVFNITVNIAALNNLIVNNQINRSFSISQGNSIVIRKGVGHIVPTISVPNTIGLIRSVGKSISLLAPTFTSFLKPGTLTKTFSTSTVPIISLLRQVGIFRTATSSPTISIVKNILRTLNIVNSTITSSRNSVGKTFIADSETDIFMSRSITPISYVLITICSVLPSAFKSFPKTFSVSVSSVPKILMQHGYTVFIVSTTVVASVIKNINRQINVVSSSFVSAVSKFAWTKIILVQFTPTILITKSLGLTKSVISSTVIALVKLPTKIFSVTASSVISVVKQATKMLTTLAPTTLVGLYPGGGLRLTLNKLISVSSTTIVSANKLLQKMVTVTSSSVASCIRNWGLD